MKETKTMTVKDIYTYIDSFAPFSSAEDWDNPGLLVDCGEKEISKAVVCLDVTAAAVEAAAEKGAELIISHHPAIFRPIKKIGETSPVFEAIRNGISVLCAHTNLDRAPGGVNDALCEAIGEKYEKSSCAQCEGFVNIISFSREYTPRELSELLSEKLGGIVRFSDAGKTIVKAGVCSGSGAEFSAFCEENGCDAFITGDASHHDFLDAKQSGISLFAAGHYETEIPAVAVLAGRLEGVFPDVEFIPFEENNPVDYSLPYKA